MQLLLCPSKVVLRRLTSALHSSAGTGFVLGSYSQGCSVFLICLEVFVLPCYFCSSNLVLRWLTDALSVFIQGKHRFLDGFCFRSGSMSPSRFFVRILTTSLLLPLEPSIMTAHQCFILFSGDRQCFLVTFLFHVDASWWFFFYLRLCMLPTLVLLHFEPCIMAAHQCLTFLSRDKYCFSDAHSFPRRTPCGFCSFACMYSSHVGSLASRTRYYDGFPMPYLYFRGQVLFFGRTFAFEEDAACFFLI